MWRVNGKEYWRVFSIFFFAFLYQQLFFHFTFKETVAKWKDKINLFKAENGILFLELKFFFASEYYNLIMEVICLRNFKSDLCSDIYYRVSKTVSCWTVQFRNAFHLNGSSVRIHWRPGYGGSIFHDRNTTSSSYFSLPRLTFLYFYFSKSD